MELLLAELTPDNLRLPIPNKSSSSSESDSPRIDRVVRVRREDDQLSL
jgi:hypothetical protein